LTPTIESRVVFEHRHPVDGALRLVREAETIRVDCRWPFDDDLGDWMYLSTEVACASIERCADALELGRTVRGNGLRGGFIEFGPHANGTSIEIADWMGPSPRRLSLIVAQEPKQLADRLRPTGQGS
jgi:hypothetical protein